MTNRQHLRSALFRFHIALAVCFALLVAEFLALALTTRHFARREHPHFIAFAYVCLISGLAAALGGSWVYGHTAVRCPSCRVSLFSLMQQKRPERIKCCPYCEVGLDDPMPEVDRVDRGKGKPVEDSWQDDELA